MQVADRFHLLRNLREALGTPPPVAPSTPSNPALTRSQQLSAEAETLRTLSASNQVIPARHLTPRHRMPVRVEPENHMPLAARRPIF